MKVIILGGGVAGFTAAETIRKNDKGCEICLFTEEEYPPYYRPRLIDLIAKKTTIEDIYIKNPEWYKDNNIILKLGARITGIDTALKKIICDNREETGYDKLLLALGSYPFKPSIKGIDSKRVYTLRTARDAFEIIKCAETKKRALIIGGGLLGIETANSLCSLDVKTKVVEFFEYLLPRQVDTEGAGFIQKILKNKGIDFMMETEVEEIKTEGDSLKVMLANNNIVETDFVIVSSGVRANISIAEKAGIKVNRGVVVNSRLRTSVEAVFAAGDICEHRNKLYGIWQAAREQAIAAAENITGKDNIYRGSVFSTRLKVAGIDLTSIGDISGKNCKQYVFTDDSRNIYKKLFVRDGMVKGAILFGDTGKSLKIQKMIKNEIDMSGKEREIIEGERSQEQ